MFAIMSVGGSMHIQKITKLKSGKYKITFDNKESITTYDDVVLGENLLYQKDVDLEKLKKLLQQTSYFDIYHKMVRLISVKYRSKKEIEMILEKEKLEETERRNIISSLIQNDFINDKRFTECYINDRLYLSSDGPFLISKNLLSYGIEDSIIKEAFAKIDPSVFYEKLEKLVQKKIKNNIKYSRYILENKIVQVFKEKGFEEDMIRQIFDSHFVDDYHVIDKEYQKLMKKLSLKYEGNELAFKIKQKLYSKGFMKTEIENVFIENKMN